VTTDTDEERDAGHDDKFTWDLGDIVVRGRTRGLAAKLFVRQALKAADDSGWVDDPAGLYTEGGVVHPIRQGTGDDKPSGGGGGGAVGEKPPRQEPRTSADDPVDRFLPGIKYQCDRFYADPANKVEVLDKTDPANQARLQELHDEATGMRQALQAQANAVLRGESDMTPVQYRRQQDGLSYMSAATRPGTSGHVSGGYYVAVATHDGHPVAAVDYMGDPGQQIGVFQLGSAGAAPGAGSAVSQAVAAHGAAMGSTGLASGADIPAIPFHQSMGRVVTSQGEKSTWSAADIQAVGGVSDRASLPS
jgi:hypothetical protein